MGRNIRQITIQHSQNYKKDHHPFDAKGFLAVEVGSPRSVDSILIAQFTFRKGSTS